MSASGPEVKSPGQRFLVKTGGLMSRSDADYQGLRSLVKCQRSSVKTRLSGPEFFSQAKRSGQRSLVNTGGPGKISAVWARVL